MAAPPELSLVYLTTFALVLVRIAALVTVAPVFGTLAMAPRIRLLLAFALTLWIVPLEVARGAVAPPHLAALLVAAGGEALVGLTLGLGVRILFAGVHLAGQVIGQLSGLHLAAMVGEGTHESAGGFSQLLLVVASGVFLSLGGHRLVVEALLDSFVGMPPGQGTFSQSALEATTTLLAHSFALGLRAAAPAMLALLLATLIVGVMSRALARPGALSLGVGVNALVALVAVGASLGGACWVFQDQIEGMLATALTAVTAH